MKVIRRRASEIAPAILQCYNGAGSANSERIRYRVIRFIGNRVERSDFALECDAKSLISWCDSHGIKAQMQTIIAGGVR